MYGNTGKMCLYYVHSGMNSSALGINNGWHDVKLRMRIIHSSVVESGAVA
jgi:hypothetical protein